MKKRLLFIMFVLFAGSPVFKTEAAFDKSACAKTGAGFVVGGLGAGLTYCSYKKKKKCREALQNIQGLIYLEEREAELGSLSQEGEAFRNEHREKLEILLKDLSIKDFDLSDIKEIKNIEKIVKTKERNWLFATLGSLGLTGLGAALGLWGVVDGFKKTKKNTDPVLDLESDDDEDDSGDDDDEYPDDEEVEEGVSSDVEDDDEEVEEGVSSDVEDDDEEVEEGADDESESGDDEEVDEVDDEEEMRLLRRSSELSEDDYCPVLALLVDKLIRMRTYRRESGLPEKNSSVRERKRIERRISYHLEKTPVDDLSKECVCQETRADLNGKIVREIAQGSGIEELASLFNRFESEDENEKLNYLIDDGQSDCVERVSVIIKNQEDEQDDEKLFCFKSFL